MIRSVSSSSMPSGRIESQPSPQEASVDEHSSDAKQSCLDAILKCYGNRGIGQFYHPGGAEKAADSLVAAERVMLLTGFNVAEGMPETDGPGGTAALANALNELGKIVILVTDGTNRPVLEAALNVLNPELATFAKFVRFSAVHETGVDSEAKRLLERETPDAVVAIEVPARNSLGIRRNMRGENINAFNQPLDGLLLEARKANITTIGVGDGGNEAGMGSLIGIPKAADGSEMKSAVCAQYPVTAWNSNFGAEAVAAVLLAKHGQLEKLHTPQQEGAMIEAMLKAGAVDGVTRKSVAGAKSDKGDMNTGVDGFSPNVHEAMIELLKNVVAGMELGVIGKCTPRSDAPFLIGSYDSSNGGLIAAKNLAGFIAARSRHTARFVIVTDHGNAPYGEKSRGELIALVGKGLHTMRAIGVDIVAMACNTACTAFPDAQLPSSDGIPDIPVLDLIEVTAEAMAKHGGSKPVILGTFATTATGPGSSNRYDDEIKLKSNGAKSLPLDRRIAAPEWADMINRLDHLNDKPEVIEKVKKTVEKYVKKIPVDATSVWLCCTHYPALKSHIEAALRKDNRSIEVIDPMEYQADKIVQSLNNIKDADRSMRHVSTDPIVVTTGNFTEVESAAKKLLGNERTIVLKSEFGQDFSFELLRGQIFLPEKITSARNAPIDEALPAKRYRGEPSRAADYRRVN